MQPWINKPPLGSGIVESLIRTPTRRNDTPTNTNDKGGAGGAGGAGGGAGGAGGNSLLLDQSKCPTNVNSSKTERKLGTLSLALMAMKKNKEENTKTSSYTMVVTVTVTVTGTAAVIVILVGTGRTAGTKRRIIIKQT